MASYMLSYSTKQRNAVYFQLLMSTNNTDLYQTWLNFSISFKLVLMHSSYELDFLIVKSAFLGLRTLGTLVTTDFVKELITNYE